MIINYWLVNQLWYFYDADSDDVTGVLEAQVAWLREHPEFSIVATRTRVGFDEASESPYVEGEIEYCTL